MHFLYAIPNCNSVNEKKLEEAGLMNIFEDIKPNFSQRYTAQGPGEKDCTLLCIGNDATQLYFKPAEQDWQQSLNERYYIGFYKNNKPTERELRREIQLEGHDVKLGDGEKWLIPVAREFPVGIVLPQSLMLGKNGEVISGGILPQYAQFGMKAEKVWEEFKVGISQAKQKDEMKLTLSEGMEFAIDALAFNYYVGTEEVNLLELITSQNLQEIIEAVIDMPAVLEAMKQWQSKKNETDSQPNDG